MKTSTSTRTSVAIVCAVCLGACKPRTEPAAALKEIPPPSGDTSFTPPEIRRSAPSESASTALAKPSADSGSRVRAASAEPSLAPAPVPAQPTPARKPTAVSETAPVAEASPPPVAVSAEPGPDGDWVLQVNIHKTEADARAQVAKLAAAGIPAYALPVPTDGAGLAGQYWRVRVGRFASRAAAQAYGQSRIVPRGLKFWIDRKSNESRPGGAP